jgi:DNA-binding response OmpR family regulator
MNPKILIVDDEPHMRRGLRDNLEFEGYQVEEAVDGIDALEKLVGESYSLIILDVMMPRMSGFEVCKQIRKEGNDVPIIILTAKGEEIDKVLGLEIGADDYIEKPFSIRELIARIKAILRRSGNHTSNKDEVTIGALKVDFKKYLAFKGDQPEKMSHKEFEILHYLLNHKNEVVDRFDLLKNVWGYDEHPSTRTVDNFIVKLRQKVELNASDPKVILTIHGVGYKLLID